MSKSVYYSDRSRSVLFPAKYKTETQFSVEITMKLFIPGKEKNSTVRDKTLHFLLSLWKQGRLLVYFVSSHGTSRHLYCTMYSYICAGCHAAIQLICLLSETGKIENLSAVSDIHTYTVGLKCPTNNKQFSWYCPCKGTVPWNKYGFLIRAVALMLNNGPWTDLFYNFLILCNNYLCTFKFNGPVHYFFRRAIFITRGITGPLNLPVHR